MLAQFWILFQTMCCFSFMIANYTNIREYGRTFSMNTWSNAFYDLSWKNISEVITVISSNYLKTDVPVIIMGAVLCLQKTQIHITWPNSCGKASNHRNDDIHSQHKRCSIVMVVETKAWTFWNEIICDTVSWSYWS